MNEMDERQDEIVEEASMRCFSMEEIGTPTHEELKRLYGLFRGSQRYMPYFFADRSVDAHVPYYSGTFSMLEDAVAHANRLGYVHEDGAEEIRMNDKGELLSIGIISDQMIENELEEYRNKYNISDAEFCQVIYEWEAEGLATPSAEIYVPVMHKEVDGVNTWGSPIGCYSSLKAAEERLVGLGFIKTAEECGFTEWRKDQLVVEIYGFPLESDAINDEQLVHTASVN